MADIVAILTAKWKGDPAVARAKKGMDEFSDRVEANNKKIKKNGETLQKYGLQVGAAAGVLVGVGLAAQKAYQFIGEGAELSFAQEKFDKLAVSIGTTASALQDELTVATHNTISQASLTANAVEIMSLKLATTSDGVIRMATVVGELNLNMEVLGLTLANDSVLRLDNLGIALVDVNRTMDELKANGFIGDAFDEAVLIELEKKVLLLGPAFETTAGAMKVLEAAVADFTDGSKLAVAESDLVAESIGTWALVATGINQTRKDQEVFNTAVAMGILNLEDYQRLLGQDYVTALDDARDAIAEMNLETAAADSILMRYGETVTWAIPIVDRLAIDTGNLGDKARQTASHLSEEEAALRSANAAHIEGNAAIAGAVEGRRLLREETERLEEATRESAQAALDFAGIPTGAESIIEGYALLNAQINSVGESFDVATSAGNVLEEKLTGFNATFFPEIFLDIEQPLADLTSLEEKLGELDGLTVSPHVDLDTSEAEARLAALTAQLGSLGAARAIGPELDGRPLASGGSTLGGGSFLVGETGPEMVTLPGNSSVMNAQDYSQHTTNIVTSDHMGAMQQQQIAARRR